MVRALAAVIVTLSQQAQALQAEVEVHSRAHPDAEILLSQPGLGVVLGARVLAEFGDDPARYASQGQQELRRHQPLHPPVRQEEAVIARYVHNDRLRDALGRQAYSALTASPEARAYYDELRDRNIEHEPALRQLANRLAGILTAASRPEPSTTSGRPGPGITEPKSRLLDNASPWDASPRQSPPLTPGPSGAARRRLDPNAA